MIVLFIQKLLLFIQKNKKLKVIFNCKTTCTIVKIFCNIYIYFDKKIFTDKGNIVPDTLEIKLKTFPNDFFLQKNVFIYIYYYIKQLLVSTKYFKYNK